MSVNEGVATLFEGTDEIEDEREADDVEGRLAAVLKYWRWKCKVVTGDDSWMLRVQIDARRVNPWPVTMSVPSVSAPTNAPLEVGGAGDGAHVKQAQFGRAHLDVGAS